MKSAISFLATLLLQRSSKAASANLPPGHPLQAFTGTLKCPYSQQWLTKGPERAARELG
eukprot:CAMPEP_0172499790 /NCGR_PEP_ID=MMETSP1066-20121228/131016_1 /TAXON_ID=671091 /ORGANISM="Coscinodiscus wailesii, Strain CCMP2513" /LENGTH=58 /DNA_ID=CAMNT_0013273715 /DNA_START=107 /DNA_END=279 /DNA_ORIENTATION=+